jgi:hypothetical protein
MMMHRITLFRLTALLGAIGALSSAVASHADTKVCPPPPGTPWGEGYNATLAHLNAPADCWLGTSYATATENVGRGNILVGPSGGSDRVVWAYNFNSGPAHDYVKVTGFNLSDVRTCGISDTTKNAQPVTVGGQTCIGTLYATVEGWHF